MGDGAPSKAMNFPISPRLRRDASLRDFRSPIVPGIAASAPLVAFGAARLGASDSARRRAFGRGKARRRGVSLYMFLLAFPMIIGLLGIVVDLGNIYSKRAQAQRAADAAAIAGVMDSGVAGGDTFARAREYAALNGYKEGVNNAKVDVRTNVTAGDTELIVTVSRKEPVFFIPILEGFLKATGQSQTAAQFSREVSAQGTARTRVSLPLGLGGIYGVADPSKSPVNNSVFGPYANYNFGDAYSTKYFQDGSANEYYRKTGGVGEYTLNVTTEYLNKYPSQNIALQIYDPDCFDGPNGYDEIRSPNTKIQPPPPGPRETTTVYELYAPNAKADDKPLASATYGNDQSTDGKWVTPDKFSFKPTRAGAYKIKIRTTEGSSENGFQLRAGPADGAAKTDDEWNQTYGDKAGTDPNNVALGIDANDHLQINFTQTGKVKFRLGYVPQTQAGKTISVSKFDVDVGSTSIVYSCDALPGTTFPGVLPVPGDGVWSTDSIKVPAGYTGGNWYAEYSAARGDSSTWTLSGAGGDGREVRLIR